MAAKSSEWRPGPTVCRCCLTEGCYKDISTEYFWMGKREVYAEMLKDTLEITISYSKAGGPNSNSRLICEPCISRLRDATEFKRQVVECERMFMQHLDPGSTSQEIEVEAAPLEKIKVEGVKLENSHSDDDFGDHHFGDDDDDDDLDNQPLTKLASKTPKKESVDFMDLLDNSKAAEKRKSTSKAKPPPPKKTKTKVEPSTKPSSSKAKPEKKKKEQNPMTMARRNAQIIVQYTTAYPFKLPECTLVCVYCQESLQTAHFRTHMETQHQDFKIKVAFAHLNEGYIKADCTNLKCRTCLTKFDTLENIANHLVSVHKRPLNLKFDLGVQPFVFHTDQLKCALCPMKFATLRTLSRHTQSHFRKCTCEVCGKSYLTSTSLQHHMRYIHSIGSEQRMCEKCKSVFDSPEAKRKHVSESPKCWRYSCRVCFERFMSATLRHAHQKEAHGIDKRSYVCPECKIIFPSLMRYRVHFKINHTEEFLVCTCGRKFESKHQLEKHRVTHTKERLFPCPECSKSFPRKSSLKSHMWIHSENKRFECKVCNKPFNQKVSWKTHMKSYHPEIVNF